MRVRLECALIAAAALWAATVSGQTPAAQDWSTLDKQAEEAYGRGDLKEAIRLDRLAVQAAHGEKESARSLDRLGFFEYTAGNLKEGERLLRQAIDLRRKAAGPDSADYAESANDLALFCRDSGKLAEARSLAGEAVEIRRKVFGARDLRVAESLNTLGSTIALEGEYEGAIARFEDARAIHESQAEPREFSEEYGTLCVNLAGTYQRVGRYVTAEGVFARGLEVLRHKPGVNHPAYSASLTAFAYLQAELGHYSAAERLYDEAGKLMRAQLGEEHAYYAAFLNNRAALYSVLGNTAGAEADYRRALELKRKIFGPSALTVGATLRNLGRLVYGRNPPEGERLFQQAVDLYRGNPKAPPFDYSSALLGLAEGQRNRGNLAAARETLGTAEGVSRSGLGAKHPLYGAVLRDQGLVHQAAREYGPAKDRLEEAAAIVAESQGESHPDMARYWMRLAALYDEMGDYAAAGRFYRRSVDLSDRALADMLATGSESSKAALVASLEDPLPALLGFQQRAGASMPEARVLAFEAAVRRKGRVLDEVHDWGRRLREHPDPGVRTRFEQRQAMMECQASLTLALGYRDLKPAVVGNCALPGTPLAGRYEKLLYDLRAGWTEGLRRQAFEAIAGLKKSVDELESALSRDLPQFAPAMRAVRLEEIRSRLRVDEKLLEFTAYARGGSGHYGVFVLDGAGTLVWADLGAAAPVDRAVKDLIAAANDWTVSRSAGEARSARAAEETARDAMRTLSAKLGPALAAATEGGVRRLRISPDGMLNLVPFAALDGAGGRPLIESISISYVPAGRDLAAAADEKRAGRALAGEVVIAVSPGAGTGGRPAPSPETVVFRADRLERLQGAQLEARDVQKRIPRAVVLGEGEATEARLKQLRKPALLHIVGHGIVRGAGDCEAAPESPGCRLAGIDPAARVMGLSAIVLEEAYGRARRPTQDGLLTALELQTLDLEGSEMLVLSQCRMADGVATSGEGVYGMRRAAAIAGVRSFVAPLWKVADSAERSLMARFYQELSVGKGRAEALRLAQIELMRSPKKSSFLEWAPVILSGEPGPLPKELFAH